MSRPDFQRKIPSYLKSTQASRARSPEKAEEQDAGTPDFITDSLQPSPAESTSSSPPPASDQEPTSSKQTQDATPELGSHEQSSEETAPPIVTKATKTVTQAPLPSHQATKALPIAMGHTKIRVFRGTRDGKEDPNEFLEDIEWAYEQDFKSREPAAATALGGSTVDQRAVFANKTHRILFRQHLEDDALQWYSDLDTDLKQDWAQLKKAFLPAFAITVKDAQTKKFELRIKLANLEQSESKMIAEYLKRADKLAIRLPQDHIDVGMAILKGIRDTSKRECVSFKCGKDADYTYATVI